jgi:single-strand DNA-binding protein
MTNATNKVHLLGHLGKEPMVKQFESGSKMATFTLATNESYTNSVGKQIENTQWHKLVAWGAVAGQVERLLTKGSKISAEGKLSHRHYEAKDGVKKYVTEIVLNEFELIKSEKAEAANA